MTAISPAMPAPEFSKPVDPRAVGPGGQDFAISANKHQRAGLARRFNLAALEQFSAQGRIEPGKDGQFRIRGRLQVRATQICVVTLEPVPGNVTHDFEVAAQPAQDQRPDPGPGGSAPEDPFDDTDPPFEFDQDGVDLGELAAQIYAEQIELYPRKPGISLSDTGYVPEGGDDDARDNPFNILRSLKEK